MLRKTAVRRQADRHAEAASMRPQRNAAENDPRGGRAVDFLVASMRPQRNAAENFRG